MADFEIERISDASFIKMRRNDLEVVLCDYGASIYDVVFKGQRVTSAPQDKEYFYKNGYWGKFVGRIAGRIGSGILRHKGKEYRLDINERHCSLHGGENGYSFSKFDYEFKDEKVIFHLSADTYDQGMPGNLDINVIYSIIGDNLLIEIECKSDEETYLNPTIHTYFNLGESDILGHRLKIDALEVETYDDELLPLGMGNIPQHLDFSSNKLIGADINDESLQNHAAKGYDHCYRLKDNKIVLSSNNIRMTLESSAPAIQIYTNNYPLEGARFTDCDHDSKHHSIALEPVFAPNDFDSMRSKKDVWSKMYISYLFERIE